MGVGWWTRPCYVSRMSFKTTGQEAFSKIIGTLFVIALWGGGMVSILWLVKACDLATPQQCVCECGER